MNKSDINKIKKNLQEKREDLLKVVNNNQMIQNEGEVGDEADVASSSLEKEITFELNDNERVMLDNIESALAKIDRNVFGLCESCRKKITETRLKAMPFARFCISCQSKSEQK
ncbi:MAG: TraR/DksA family transcriptional regulator [bacterium]